MDYRKRFQDKMILVIGATGGIGSMVTKKIILEGGTVIAFSRNHEKLDSLKLELGDRLIPFIGDATKSTDLGKVVEFIENTYSSLDSVIHAVGSILLRSIPALSEDQFKECLEINLVSPFNTIKSTLALFLKNKKGSYVFTSSVAAKVGLQNHEAISAAKGGLEALVRSCSMTYAKKNIRFNSVAMGLIDTPLANFLTKSEVSLNASVNMHPMNRIGKPEDVVEGILYLASDDSSWVTGTVLPIDGGMSTGKG
jgi:NAD(P)-dependent dehydrogenase (short-subunit alcohol dehydrogenase family)